MNFKIAHFVKSFLRTYNFIRHHPLTRDRKLSALKRIFKWQVFSRMYAYPIILPFAEGTKLIVERGMTGATGNLYAGLHDFEDMAFLLQFLKEGDVFGDIGANIGAYTVLASGVVKARSVSIEPVPATFNSLKRNVKENNLEELVELHNKGAGATEGNLKFTNNLDTVNHVISDSNSVENTIVVQVETLNKLFAFAPPSLLKIDVEGFEWYVLKGSESVLSNSALQAIIIELNESGNRYNITDEQIRDFLLSFQFVPYSYNPFKRELIPKPHLSGYGNTIFIKNKKLVEQRIFQSKKFSVLGKSF